MTDGRPVLMGGAASPSDVARARAVLGAADVQLTNVRSAAARWQAGLAGLAGGITAFSLISGRDEIATLAPAWAAWCGVALVCALAASLAGGVLAMRSAFGLPTLVRTRRWDPAADTANQARSAYRLLRWAIWLTLASIVALVAALGVVWYAPRQEKAPVLVVVPATGSSVCGEVARADGSGVTLRTAAGERTVPWPSVTGLEPRASCPAG